MIGSPSSYVVTTLLNFGGFKPCGYVDKTFSIYLVISKDH